MRFTSFTFAFCLTVALGACDEVQSPPPSVCRAQSGDSTPSATEVCARLNTLGCLLTDCNAAYESYRTHTAPEEFSRLTACYVRATDCDQVDQCGRACGADGGAVTVRPVFDAAVEDVQDSAVSDVQDSAVGDLGADATPVTDTGSSTPDTGNTPTDTGNTPTDTGNTPTDTGNNTPDSGTPPTDTGNNTPDSGSSIGDAAVTADTGDASDSGSATDSAMKITDLGAHE